MQLQELHIFKTFYVKHCYIYILIHYYLTIQIINFFMRTYEKYVSPTLDVELIQVEQSIAQTSGPIPNSPSAGGYDPGTNYEGEGDAF